MSGIKQPILDIMNRLNNSGFFQHVRIWNNQIDYETAGKTYDFPKPAAFVEVVASPIYQEAGLGMQSADIGFKIHIAHEQLDTGDFVTMEQNVAVFDLRDNTVMTLSLYEPTACGPLVKVNETLDDKHTNIYHYVIEFICNFMDSTGSKVYENNPNRFIPSIAPLPYKLNIP